MRRDMHYERDAEQRQIARYFSEVSEQPLLSRDQEIALAQQKDAGIKARRQLQRLTRVTFPYDLNAPSSRAKKR